jgi:hypothetical protein
MEAERNRSQRAATYNASCHDQDTGLSLVELRLDPVRGHFNAEHLQEMNLTD